jgi:hypothetical protein
LGCVGRKGRTIRSTYRSGLRKRLGLSLSF